MFVLGCSPHSGPSVGKPTTGTPSCWGSLYAPPEVRSEMKIKPKTCLTSTRSATAVWAPVKLLPSSATSSLSLRPSMPPCAFCRAKRASMPLTALGKPLAAGPVKDVSSPIVIELDVTPGELSPAAPAIPAGAIVNAAPSPAATTEASRLRTPTLLIRSPIRSNGPFGLPGGGRAPQGAEHDQNDPTDPPSFPSISVSCQLCYEHVRLVNCHTGTPKKIIDHLSEHPQLASSQRRDVRARISAAGGDAPIPRATVPLRMTRRT